VIVGARDARGKTRIAGSGRYLIDNTGVVRTLVGRWFCVLVLCSGALACSRRQLAESQGTGTLDGGGRQDAAGGGQGGAGGGGNGGGGGAGASGDGDAGVAIPGTICAGDHWCWINPLPAAGLDGASWSLSADDAWLVGRAGAILRWRSGVWSSFDSGTSENLHAVFAADATEAWAIGDRGTIVHWDGQRWSPIVSPVTKDLLCISGVGPGDIWAMGADATAVHWGGTVWSEVEAPATNGDALTGVWAASPTSVFAVSQSGIFHWHGSWSRAPAEFSGFSAIWGAHDSDVWAVGQPDSREFPSGRSAMAHWNGTNWAFAPAPDSTATTMFPTPFSTVWGTGSNDVWADGTGTFNPLAHFDGKMWSWAASGSPGGHLGGGRGGAVFISDGGDLSQLVRGNWQHRSSSQVASVAGMWMQSPSDGWVVGDRSIFHWDGSTWSLATTVTVEPATVLYAISGTRSDDVWAVGAGGVIVHWDGVAWTTTKISDVMYLNSVWGSSPTDVWASSGLEGKAFHYDGSAWTVAMLGAKSSGGIWGTAANDVWIGGRGGLALHWDGQTWTTIPIPVQTISWIAGSGPNDVWAIGSDTGPSVLLHWDGQTWTRSPDGDNIGQLIALSATAPNNAWTVGYRGALAHWDGQTWTRSRVAYNGDLNSVFAFRDGTTWIAGNDGAILRRIQPDWR